MTIMKYHTLPPTVSVKQCAGVKGVSERTIHTLIKNGEIESIKVGRSRRILTKPLLEEFDADTLLDYLNGIA